MMENTELLTELYATVNKILNIVTELKKNRPDANATSPDGSTVDLDLKADILSLKVGFEFYVQQMQLMVRTVSNLSPNFNFSLPDMTNLEDLYRNILNDRGCGPFRHEKNRKRIIGWIRRVENVRREF